MKIGEYWIQVICRSDSKNKFETIVNMESDKVLKIEFNTEPYTTLPVSDLIKKNGFCDSENTYKTSTFKSPTDYKQNSDPISYAAESGIKNELVIVWKNNKCCLFDISKNANLSNWYDDIETYCHYEYCIVENNGKEGLISSSGEELLPCIYDSVAEFDTRHIIITKDGKDGVCDILGNEIVPCIYDEIDTSMLEQLLTIKENERFGIIDINGNTIIPPIYDEEIYFEDSIATVKSNNKCGYIDTEGKIVLPLIYDECYSFREGGAIVVINGHYLIINSSGKIIFSNQDNYKLTRNLYSGQLIEIQKNDKRGVIDSRGKIIVPCIYDYIFIKGEDEVIQVTINHKWGIYNKNGIEIIPCIYNGLEYFESHKLFFGEKDKKFGLFDMEGNNISPFIYDSHSDWWESDELIFVEKGRKFGFINNNGDEIIPCIYDEVQGFKNGYASVRDGDTWKLISTTGVPIFIDIEKDSFVIKTDMICIKKQGKFGIIDFNGNEIIPCIYDKIDVYID